MMLHADAVSRIEMADNLLDHYTGIISRARDAARRRNNAELDLQIADARRVYPLIWEALDDAGRSLAARGCDVSLYRRLRDDRGEESEPVSGDGLPRRISTRLRHRGAMLAEEVSEALKRAVPDHDWHAIGVEPGSLKSSGWLALFSRGARDRSQTA
jgi:hypothetical protein